MDGFWLWNGYSQLGYYLQSNNLFITFPKHGCPSLGNDADYK